MNLKTLTNTDIKKGSKNMEKIIYSEKSPFETTSKRIESAKNISDISSEGPVSIWYEPETDEIVPDWCSSENAVWITELFGHEEPEFILEITDTILRDEEFMEMYFEDHPQYRRENNV